MKKAIEVMLLVIGVVCFVFLCSEPAQGAATRSWVIWEICWFAGLLVDVAIAEVLDRKGIIKTDNHA